jgi:hypothetical protein
LAQGSLPLVMMFDLPDLLEIDDMEVQKVQVFAFINPFFLFVDAEAK